MYTLGFVLLGVGILVAFGAFAFAGANMVRAFQDGEIGSLFTKHIFSMVVMALGGLSSLVGIIILVATFLKSLIGQ